VHVRPNVDVSGDEKRIISGIDVRERVLRGVVSRIAPAVTIDVQVGDEVLFRRPEGELPEVALMDQELVLAVLSYPKYGADEE